MFEYLYGENVASSYPGVTVSIERITPSLAERMLETNVSNREMKREPIARAIASGEWMLNGATIVFSDTGVLLDGQNRLKACISSDRPIDTIVVRGLPALSQTAMDVGVKRQAADFLRMQGYADSKMLAAIGATLYRKTCNGIESCFNRSSSDEITLFSILRFTQDNYEEKIAPLLPSCRKVKSRFTGVRAGTLAALFDTFMEAGDDDFDEFINQLVGDTDPCRSVRLLRDKLFTNMARKDGKLPQKTIAALFIKAWNAFMMGTEPEILKFAQGGAHPESFPEIYLGND